MLLNKPKLYSFRKNIIIFFFLQKRCQSEDFVVPKNTHILLTEDN